MQRCYVISVRRGHPVRRARPRRASIGDWRVLTRGFGFYALALWFMGALRLVGWTFALPLDAETFDEAFRYAYLVYGMLACTTLMFYLFFTRRSPAGDI